VTGPLPRGQYLEIFRKVPRLTVEVVACSESGVLLVRRTSGPCKGLWNVPGGTVRFAESLTDAVHRVALDEIGSDVVIDCFLGYIEYPSHARQGLDWPVGMAFCTHLVPPGVDGLSTVRDGVEWFEQLPDEMHDEQRTFLQAHNLVR
jgi:ADP-ribose pyrophosphatase YjhB (NUDIX family)